MANNYHLQKWAHKELTLAVRKGLIIRPDKCEVCGQNRKLCAHHSDYALPLEVKWVCYPCHGKEHLEKAERIIEMAKTRPTPKMKKALAWLREHPEHLDTESRVLAELIGVSHTLANEARKYVKVEIENQ